MSKPQSSLFNPPVRDLQSNWEIDVAAELDAYLSQLEESQLASEDDKFGDLPSGKLNFIEAALLLQSGTTIYSRKVEYLRSLAYEALQNFASASGGAKQIATMSQPLKSKQIVSKKSVKLDTWDINDLFYVPWNAFIPPKEPQEFEIYSSYPQDPQNIRTQQPEETDQKYTPCHQPLPLFLIPENDPLDLYMTTTNLCGCGVILMDLEDESDLISKQPVSLSKSLEPPKPHMQNSDTILSAYPSSVEDFTAHDDDDVDSQKLDATESWMPQTDHTGQQDTDITTGVTPTLRSRFDAEMENAPIKLLDCHKPSGRNRPLKVGTELKPVPDPEMYLSSIESLKMSELNQMLYLFSVKPPGNLHQFSDLLNQHSSETQWSQWEIKEPCLITQYGLPMTWISIEPKLRGLIRKSANKFSNSSNVNQAASHRQEIVENIDDTGPLADNMEATLEYYDDADDEILPDTEPNEQESLNICIDSNPDIEKALIEANQALRISELEQPCSALSDMRIKEANQKKLEWQQTLQTHLAETSHKKAFNVAEHKKEVMKEIKKCDTHEIDFLSMTQVSDKSTACRTFLTLLMMSYEQMIELQPDVSEGDLGISGNIRIRLLNESSISESDVGNEELAARTKRGEARKKKKITHD